MISKLRPELSFHEVSLAIAVLRESRIPSANDLATKLHEWTTEIIDTEAYLQKTLLDVPLKDRA
jgi:hypothetical protein